MHFSFLYIACFAALASLISAVPHDPAATTAAATCSTFSEKTTPALNITATTAINGKSIIQCWQLEPFTISSTTGVVGALIMNLGDSTVAEFAMLPGRYDGGIHNANERQFIFFTSGLVHLSVPGSPYDAWVHGGKYGITYAEDVANVSTTGHLSQYPSDETTIIIAVPLAPGAQVKHKVLHNGGCTLQDWIGL